MNIPAQDLEEGGEKLDANYLSKQGYSILAQAMELAEIQERLWLDKYTILAEHDSIYHRNGIYNVEELYERVVPPGILYTNRKNAFDRFAGFAFIGAANPPPQVQRARYSQFRSL